MSATSPRPRRATSPSTVLSTPPPHQSPTGKRSVVAPVHSDDDDEGDYNLTLAHAAFDSETETVVPYDKGATELFLAIEEGEWERALRITRDEPGLARVWVASTGTENTAFSWNLWRRLPIHEACRRQPPPLLISELLSVHPDSASHTTHFGELPLHLAVGCGACPAVVDLLLASNFYGADVADNGGRTALEILDDVQLREDSQVIKESLERCVDLLDRERALSNQRMRRVREEHQCNVDAIQADHSLQLAAKDDVITGLRAELERGDKKAADLSAQIDDRDSKICDKISNERALMEQLRKLEDEVSDLMGKNRALRGRVADLDDTVMKNEAIIAKLNARVDELQGDLAVELSAQEDIIGEELVRAEVEVAMMVKSQRDLAARIKGRKDAFKKKLEGRGVDLPVDPIAPPPLDETLLHSDESKSTQQPEELADGYSREKAAQATATAAARYLEQDMVDLDIAVD